MPAIAEQIPSRNDRSARANRRPDVDTVNRLQTGIESASKRSSGPGFEQPRPSAPHAPGARLVQLASLLTNSARTRQLAEIKRAANGRPQLARAVAQRLRIKLHNGVYHPFTHPAGDVVESDDLTREERRKASKDLENDPILLSGVRLGWRNAAQNVDPVVTAMNSNKLADSGTKARATRLYRASQNVAGTVSDLLQGQKEWQDFLADQGVSKEAVLSVHRSFGFEYEFATWELINPRGEAVLSHTEVGRSESFSRLFGVPFVLETDAQQELELVAPPLLAGDENGGVNRAFMRAAHRLLLAKLVEIRTNNARVRADRLPFEAQGIGSAWTWIPAARLIQVASERKKWADKRDQVAYQLNVSLTPAEIAAQIKKVHDDALSSDHGKLYKTIRERFLKAGAFTQLPKARQKSVRPAVLILAKGLSNCIAIPTLTLVAETRTPWPRNDLHSYVKDLHGIWIKDSVPNATVAAVQGNRQAMDDLLAIIAAVRQQDLIPRDILTSVPVYKPQGAAYTEKIKALMERLDAPVGRHSTKLRLAAEAEAKACLNEVTARLGQHNWQPQQNPKTEFLEEQFGTGSGVRKDTYANIGRSRQSTLHLTEFRSVGTTDTFLV